jgi:hypothetical protein
MAFALYDFLTHDGHNPFKEWTRGLESQELAKLNQKLDMLELYGSDLPPRLFSDTDYPHIKKLRINGRIALRPLLCRGPLNMQAEFTLLLGCRERDGRLVPENGLEIAEQCRSAILTDGSRRTIHERIGKKTAR